MNKKTKNILWFREIGKDDIPVVGGKGANLGEMSSFLGDLVPNGFVVTAKAYFDFIAYNGLEEKIRKILEITNVHRPSELGAASKKIKKIIINGKINPEIGREIAKNYFKLGSFLGLKQALVAVRSSATAEDLPDASFAGQQETFLNIRGEANLINYIRRCWASLFTPRAIFYRKEKGFDKCKVGLAVIVQKMVQSEISGVGFTIDPVTNQKNKIVIEAVWGLGEYIVQGMVTPDHYEVEKKIYRISKTTTSPQRFQLVKVRGKTIKTLVPKNKQKTQKLNSAQIVKLAKIGQKIQEHYFFPQDFEWAFEKGKFYIVQTRPVTTINQKSKSKNQKAVEGELVLTGDGASPGMGQGKVIIVKKAKEIGRVKKGMVLVTTMTSPDFVPAMKKAAAIITDKGGQTSHAAIVSRELSVPCVVGAKIATKILKTGDYVAVDGNQGKIWLGKLIKSSRPKIHQPPAKEAHKIKTATKLYVNLAEPGLAKEIAKRNVDGVGLLRAEFMIAQIGIHPQKLIQEKQEDFFIKKLSSGILKFCRAFNPRPVIYRATDFKSNEYRHLKGGELFEPKEANPLLGFRGAARYIALPQVFELELEAIKIVRNKHGFKNLWLMIPFVRTCRQGFKPRLQF